VEPIRQTTSRDSAADALIQALPKIELHLHLEGSLRPATVADPARKHNPRSPFAHPDWSVGYWTFLDLPGFLTQIDPVLRASRRTAEDWHRCAVECFADLAELNVVYAEMSVAARCPVARVTCRSRTS
jgi:adenosine deaminase